MATSELLELSCKFISVAWKQVWDLKKKHFQDRLIMWGWFQKKGQLLHGLLCCVSFPFNRCSYLASSKSFRAPWHLNSCTKKAPLFLPPNMPEQCCGMLFCNLFWIHFCPLACQSFVLFMVHFAVCAFRSLSLWAPFTVRECHCEKTENLSGLRRTSILKGFKCIFNLILSFFTISLLPFCWFCFF